MSSRTRHGGILERVEHALAGAGVTHAPLDIFDIPPSRNLFVTDHESVFAKVSALTDEQSVFTHATVDTYEHDIAKHLSEVGIATPSPLTEPFTVGHLRMAPYRFHLEHPEPVTSVEIAEAAARLWHVPAPPGARNPGWESLARAALTNINALEDAATAASLSALVTNAAEKVAARVTVRREPAVVFTHGDLHYRNVLRANDGTVMLLDWERAGYWWPETEAGKFIQTALGEPSLDARYSSDGDIPGFLTAFEAGLGRSLDMCLTDAFVRLHAAAAAAYLARYEFQETLGTWYTICRSLAK